MSEPTLACPETGHAPATLATQLTLEYRVIVSGNHYWIWDYSWSSMPYLAAYGTSATPRCDAQQELARLKRAAA